MGETASPTSPLSQDASPPGPYEDHFSALSEQGQSQRSRSDHDDFSPADSEAASASHPKGATPMQKRRRVTRACDECRRKKIKCDGKMPCTHCTVYSYDCTYDQPSNRRRNPTPQYIEAIESRLQRAEALLKKVRPDWDRDGTGKVGRVMPEGRPPSHPEVDESSSRDGLRPSATDGANVSGDERDSMLESMVEPTGQLNIDDEGYWDYHGHSSGLIFLNRMIQQFGNLLGSESNASASPFLKTMPMSEVLSPNSESPIDTGLVNTTDLPPKDLALELVSNALDDATSLMRFVHQPSFYTMLNRIYDTPPETFKDKEVKFVALLYMVIALGCLFAKSENSELQRDGYESAMGQGFKYFKACRQSIDITDCRDLVSLQTVLFMVLFLQSSAKLSTCYSYIGIAQRSALRMGLHRAVATNFDPIEREVRKRVFWVIWKMDNYVGALLGLPRSLNDEDIDQDCPLEVNDECITRERILPMPKGSISLIAASNAHTRLVKILVKIIKHVYPIKGLEHSLHDQAGQSYLVSHARIKEIEQDLQDWMDQLPIQLRTGGEARPELERVQQLLRIAYAHTQMMLYRPFLHYVSQHCSAKTIDKRSYARAAAAVSISRNIIHITTEMKRRHLLLGAYWFTMYTTYFAILSLVYFVIENPDATESPNVLKDAKEGRDTLAGLSKRSMAADRCTASLGNLFDKWPARFNPGQNQTKKANKKRHAPSPNPTDRQSRQEDPEAQWASLKPQRQSSAVPTSVCSMEASLQPVLEPQFSANPSTNANIPGIRDSFTPTTFSEVHTPDSAGNSIHSAQQPLQFPYDPNDLPELNAMMFPSTDPFIYPNQPMTSIENPQSGQDMFGNPMSNDMMLPSGTSGGMYDNLEGQLFGPLPPYLMQGQQSNMAFPQQENELMSSAGNAGSQESQQLAGGVSGMNLDEILGEDDFNGALLDQSFPLVDGGTG
ncbi:MAG: hypothetical protein M1833_000596 [Piccolia ochrophora]|nr:MAG: hypothetical protein M1833_000596 [Piccolia ochrophora]